LLDYKPFWSVFASITKQKYRYNKKIIKLTELGLMYLEFYKEYIQLIEKYPDFLKQKENDKDNNR
jgi:hypothetical protein